MSAIFPDVPLQNDSLMAEEYDRLMDIKVHHDHMGEKYGQRNMRRASLEADRVNISEEMSRTGIWMQLRHNTSKPNDIEDGQRWAPCSQSSLVVPSPCHVVWVIHRMKENDNAQHFLLLSKVLPERAHKMYCLR